MLLHIIMFMYVYTIADDSKPGYIIYDCDTNDRRHVTALIHENL